MAQPVITLPALLTAGQDDDGSTLPDVGIGISSSDVNGVGATRATADQAPHASIINVAAGVVKALPHIQQHREYLTKKADGLRKQLVEIDAENQPAGMKELTAKQREALCLEEQRKQVASSPVTDAAGAEKPPSTYREHLIQENHRLRKELDDYYELAEREALWLAERKSRAEEHEQLGNELEDLKLSGSKAIRTQERLAYAAIIPSFPEIEQERGRQILEVFTKIDAYLDDDGPSPPESHTYEHLFHTFK